mmetsp:Transcript_67321/g.219286  ORF Transcript_67321/g.219286 Transcript_67321/m.219286 type:complete len:273 (+) Transcript_67321:134-952(+)
MAQPHLCDSRAWFMTSSIWLCLSKSSACRNSASFSTFICTNKVACVRCCSTESNPARFAGESMRAPEDISAAAAASCVVATATIAAGLFARAARSAALRRTTPFNFMAPGAAAAVSAPCVGGATAWWASYCAAFATELSQATVESGTAFLKAALAPAEKREAQCSADASALSRRTEGSTAASFSWMSKFSQCFMPCGAGRPWPPCAARPCAGGAEGGGPRGASAPRPATGRLRGPRRSRASAMPGWPRGASAPRPATRRRRGSRRSRVSASP